MILVCLSIVGVLLSEILNHHNFLIEKNFSADPPLKSRARRASTGKQSA
jgi:hypothetical protein